jgi:tetratricopeptide (TPR) repeat protein
MEDAVAESVAWLERISEARDPSLALDPAVSAAAVRLTALVAESKPDVRLSWLLGQLQWHRYQALPEGTDRAAAFGAAVEAFLLCFLVGGVSLPGPLLPPLADTAAETAEAWLHQSLTSDDSAFVTRVADLWEQITVATPAGRADRPARLGSLGLAYWKRYKTASDVADLDAGIAAMRQSLDDPQADAVSRAQRWSNLGTALASRYELTNDLADLDAVIAAAQEVADTLPAGHSGRATALARLATDFQRRFERSGVLADLDQAIDAGRQAVKAAAGGAGPEPHHLRDLAADLRKRYERAGRLEDLDEAVRLLEIRYTRTERITDLGDVEQVARQAVSATQPGDHRYLDRLARLGLCLRVRFTHLEADPATPMAATLTALDAAIDTDREVAAGTPAGHEEYCSRQSYLGVSLYRRFELTGSRADLDESVEASRRAAHSAPDGREDIVTLMFNLGLALHVRYQRDAVLADLDEAIGAYQDAVSASPQPEAEKRAGYRGNLAAAMRDRYQRTQQPGDLDAVIDAARAAAEAAAHAAALASPGGLIRMRLDDMLSAARMAKAAAASAEAGTRTKAMLAELLSQLAGDLITRASATASVADLNEVISASRQAMQAVPEDNSDRPRYMGQLGNALWLQFSQTGEAALLDEAAEVLRAAVGSAPQSASVRNALLRSLSMVAASRSGELHVPADLETAVEAARQAAGNLSPGDEDYPAGCEQLASALLARFEAGGATEDLDEAVRLARQSVQLSAGDEPIRAAYASRLGALLRRRFEHAGRRTDIDEAIDVGLQAVQAGPATHRDRGAWMSSAAHALRVRYEHYGRPDDAAEAVSLYRRAVEAAAAGSPSLALALSALSTGLRAQGRNTADAAMQDEAIEVTRQAAGIVTSPADRVGILSNLAAALSERFHSSGATADLDDAIGALRQALAQASDRNEQPVVLANLSGSLTQRAVRSGSLEDLNQAVEAARQAARLTQSGNPSLPWRLTTLGNALSERYHRAGDKADIREAADVLRQAADAAPPDTPRKAAILDDLGSTLSRLARDDSGPAVEELDEAVRYLRQALEITPDNPVTLGNLSGVLLERGERLSRLEDLDAAAEAARRATTLLEPDDPRRAVFMRTLGMARNARHRPAEHPVDPGDVAGPFLEALQITSAAPALRISAARMAAAVLAPIYPAYAADLLERAVLLLPELAPRSLTRIDRQYFLDDAGSLAAEAASLALIDGSPGEQLRPLAGMPDVVTFSSGLMLSHQKGFTSPGQRAARAFGLLELGRAVMLAQTLDTRSDITELRLDHPELADRYVQVCAELNSGQAPVALEPDGPGSRPPAAGELSSQAHDRRRHLASQLAATVSEIRGLGAPFTDFNRPPDLDGLIRQAQEGPVAAVNVSRYGADALLLTRDGVGRLPLPGVTRQALAEKTAAFEHALALVTRPGRDEASAASGQETLSSILEWLWDAIAMPVLDALGVPEQPGPGTPLPRIWWISTGPLTALPLHAAGHHRAPAAGPARRTVMDRAVSSYTPTVRALQHARRPRRAAPAGASQALVVAMPHTPGAPDLGGVEAEADAISRYLAGRTVTLTGPQATRDAVIAQLPHAAWAHFACHGTADPANPSDSALLLYDHRQRPLTVADISRLQLENAEFAFLSACSTADPGKPLADESVHLASAFQTAGYQQVIGTLWPVNDWAAARLASSIYQSLAAAGTANPAPFALHEQTQKLRNEWPEDPSLWAAFIHVGA